MFRFCLLFAGVAFSEKLDTILRQKTVHFKAKNVHFNWIACDILCLKMSADIVPYVWPETEEENEGKRECEEREDVSHEVDGDGVVLGGFGNGCQCSSML